MPIYLPKLPQHSQTVRTFAATLVFVISIFFYTSTPAQSQQLPARNTGNAPFISATVQFPQPQNNIAYKGVTVFLRDKDKKTKAAITFDTDLLRFAGGWFGDGLNLETRRSDENPSNSDSTDNSTKQRHSTLSGEQVFGNGNSPGWSTTTSFRDPRQIPFGPLPKQTGVYNNLTTHGQNVIFGYTIAGTFISDMPGIEIQDKTIAISRTIEIARASQALRLQVCELPGKDVKQGQNKSQFIFRALGDLKPIDAEQADLGLDPIVPTFIMAAPSEKKNNEKDQKTKEQKTAFATIAGPEGASWKVLDDKRLVIVIPASSTPCTFKLFYWRGKSDALSSFASLVQQTPLPEKLAPLRRGGPPRWNKTIKTKGKIAKQDGANRNTPYIADTLSVPIDNPWQARMRLTGFDFLPTGDAVACTLDGDVWLIRGIDNQLQSLEWKRIAAGLHKPMGLRIVNGAIYVICQDQLMRLHDLNRDDEIDGYECFNNDIMLTGDGHSLSSDLQYLGPNTSSKNGNETEPQNAQRTTVANPNHVGFYFVKNARQNKRANTPQQGALVHVSPNGTESKIIARGWRAPNGLAIAPNNSHILVTDSAGPWVPTAKLDIVNLNASASASFFGYKHVWHDGPTPDTFTPPAIWLPQSIARLPASPIWVSSDKWGPLGNKLVLLSYGKAQLLHVMTQPTINTLQATPTSNKSSTNVDTHSPVAIGAAVALDIPLSTGMMRGRFNPIDGQLYVCGYKSTGTDGLAVAGLQRIRYTKKRLHLPIAVKPTADGFSVTFDRPLHRTTAMDVTRYRLKRWNYKWSQQSLSKKYSTRPAANTSVRQGSDSVRITSVNLSKDDKTISFHLISTTPADQLHLHYDVESANGAAMKQDLYLSPARKQ